jgi:hypothetical protein
MSDEPAPLSDALPVPPPLEPPHADKPRASRTAPMRVRIVWRMEPSGPGQYPGLLTVDPR